MFENVSVDISFGANEFELKVNGKLKVVVSLLFLLQSKAFLQTAASLAPHMYEPHFNLSILSEKVTNSFNCSRPLSFVAFVAPQTQFVVFCRCPDWRSPEQLHRSPEV